MKLAVAVRHVHFEDLGVLEPLLGELGYDVRYVDAPTANLITLDVVSPDLVVVLGAPIGAFDEELYPFLRDELDVVRRRLDAQRPLLGICLGAQIIARALGAAVSPMGVKEIGFAPLQLTAAGSASPLAALGQTPVLHWHGDQFDIPTGASRLAGTDVCANQGFVYGTKVLALQFHLEADTDKIERWLVGHASELAQAGIDVRQIRTQAMEFGPALEIAARAAVGEWLRVTGPTVDVRRPLRGHRPLPAPGNVR
jgi:GMP synthase (glutamine-hydrolysing)